MRRWLARLSFPFFILAFVLAWQAWRRSQEGADGWGVTVMYLLAALLVGFALAGVRERHRPD
jgi:hypothetical protein